MIGALIGLCGALVYAAASAAGLTAGAAALLTLGVQIAVTGALHEDGLADVADGFGGGRDKMAKLAIMRDSRVGSYGVLALIFSVGLRWSALVALADPLAVGTGADRRRARCRAPSFPPSTAGWTRRASDGLAAGLGGPPGTAGRDGGGPRGLHRRAASAASALPVIAVAILAALAVGGLALRQIGGHTGDVLGACQQIVEIAVLLTLVMLPWMP